MHACCAIALSHDLFPDRNEFLVQNLCRQLEGYGASRSGRGSSDIPKYLPALECNIR